VLPKVVARAHHCEHICQNGAMGLA
jgi:hypothetical protein